MKGIFKNAAVRCIAMVLVTALLILFFAFYYYDTNISKRKNVPAITFSESYKTKISVKSTQQELLVGVSAYDAEDGDLSTNIIIEKMSNIIKGNRREITYVVCDSDNNVTKVAKEITYTDYKKPVIKPVSDVPVIKERKYADILACFKATDVIDGDISSKIRIDSIDTSKDSINRGVFPVTLSVTNSCGDIAYLESTVTLVE